MRRRRFVKTAGALTVVGVAGCLDGDEPGEGDDGNGDGGGGNGNDGNDGNGTNGEGERETNVVWEHGVGGRVDVARDGTVYGREEFTDEDGQGGVFALDASDGDHRWTYGETGGYTTYTAPVVDDAVYFGWADDAIGSGTGSLHALETDGEERWERDVGSVYDAPVVRDGTVYAGTDRGVVFAFDAEDGEQLWNFEPFSDEDAPAPTSPSVEAVSAGIVYVTAEGALYALNAEDGDETWRYEGDDRLSTAEVADGTVYATLTGRVAAFADGEELWSHEVEGTNSWIRGVRHGNVYFRHSYDLHAVDAEDGDELWSVGFGDHYSTAFDDETVYAGASDVTAFSSDGDEKWSVGLDDIEIKGISPTDGEVRAVTEEGVYRIEDGEVVWYVELPEAGVRSHLFGDEHVYVGTREKVYAVSL